TATRKPPDTLLRGRTDDLFREYFPRLVRLLSPVLRDRPLAEDLAQETMSRFLVRLDRLDTSTPVWPWLKTVAMRLAIDHLRRGAREVPYQPQEVVVDENAGAREDTYWCEEGPELVAALRDLPKRQRQALALRYLHDRDPADVARALNLSKGALDQLVFRARRNMSRRYAPISRDA
ncbi:MAG TPA: sigma-70 family RNA polymerase sigma factor, partial [Actinomycetota bacterium]|nr:sigma-70 family RNA polymerase sigma factor [Actinomycetota bacterium]